METMTATTTTALAPVVVLAARKPQAKVAFEAKSPTIVVGFIKKARVHVSGRSFRATEAVRAKLEADGWRVDFCGNIAGAWLPWEAISETSFGSLAEAKRAIREYAAERPAGYVGR